MAEAQKTGARLQGLRPNTALCCAAFGGSGPGAGAGAAGEPGPEGTSAVGGQRRRRKGGAPSRQQPASRGVGERACKHAGLLCALR